MKPPPEVAQARELLASPNSYDDEGRMLPEVAARICDLAERIGPVPENVHPLHPRLV